MRLEAKWCVLNRDYSRILGNSNGLIVPKLIPFKNSVLIHFLRDHQTFVEHFMLFSVNLILYKPVRLA